MNSPSTLSIDWVRTASVCKALGDETRLRVLELLCDGERCVCDIQSGLGISQSLLSFHLKVLRDADLVADRRAGRWAFYSLRPDALELLGDTVASVRARAADTEDSADSSDCPEASA